MVHSESPAHLHRGGDSNKVGANGHDPSGSTSLRENAAATALAVSAGDWCAGDALGRLDPRVPELLAGERLRSCCISTTLCHTDSLRGSRVSTDRSCAWI